MVDESDSDDEDAALAKPLLRSQQLQRLALTGGDSMYVPVRLDWLSAAPQLQHLTACVIQSGQAIAPEAAGQLRSLACRLMLAPSQELLAQVAAAGQQLTSLTLSRADPDGLTRRRPSRLQRPSLTLQPHLPSFTQLHSLSLLSGAERLLFTLQGPAAAWAAMPQLQQLRLQGVGLGYGTDSKPLPARRVRALASACLCVGHLTSFYRCSLWWVRLQGVGWAMVLPANQLTYG
ncbi:hypothetical protein COO60DRAFT_734316 [Scenedesmus sp. NREL 46B-D3]|nr:hypothetical protein COO60DRAFT_734316 [Scenedesmus sp. NREL 46B-D3]